MARMGFVINLDSCLDHRGCMTGCKKYKDTPMGIYLTETFTNVGGTYPDPVGYFIPVPCQHCTSPACAAACPKGALVKRDDGIVLISDEKPCEACAGKPCIGACPYGALQIDQATEKVYKCDMCYERLEQGKAPACIASCLTNSWFYGDLDDETSLVSQIINQWGEHVHQLRPESNTGPNAYYLLSKKPWNDMNSLYSPNWHD